MEGSIFQMSEISHVSPDCKTLTGWAFLFSLCRYGNNFLSDLESNLDIILNFTILFDIDTHYPGWRRRLVLINSFLPSANMAAGYHSLYRRLPSIFTILWGVVLETSSISLVKVAPGTTNILNRRMSYSDSARLYLKHASFEQVCLFVVIRYIKRCIA